MRLNELKVSRAGSDAASDGHHDPPGPHDLRRGLGYGILDAETQFPRSHSSHYPYTEPDPYEDVPYDQMDLDDLDDFIKKVNLGYTTMDTLAVQGTDPFHFVDGSKSFSDTAVSLSELGVGGSISPIPDLYKKRGRSGFRTPAAPSGHSPHGFKPVSSPTTGTKKGYASPPPDITTGPEDRPVYDLDDIPDKYERSMLRLRDLISAIHLEQDIER